MRDGRIPIIQYWDKEDIPTYIADLIATFRERNPHMRHLIFNQTTACDLIADRFGERHVKAFRACAVPAMQADYFRYCAVHALGGVYVDADLGCNAALDHLLEPKGQLFKHLGGPMVNSLFAFRSAEHPLLTMTIEIATGNIESRRMNNVGFATGPLIFTGLDRLRQDGAIERSKYAALGRNVLHMLDLVENAIDLHGPIEKAFEGVSISPRAAMEDWVRVPDQAEMLYKGEGAYWSNWQGSIYRPRT